MIRLNWLEGIRSRVRIPRNFTLAFVLIGLAIIGVAFFVVMDLRATSREVRAVYDGSVNGLDLLGELQYQAQEARRSLLYALTTNESNLQIDYAEQSRAADQRVRDLLEQHLGSGSSPGEKAVSDRFREDWDAYLRARDQMIALIFEGSTGVAIELDLKSGIPAFNRVRDDLQEMTREHRRDAESHLNRVEADSNRSLLKLIAVLCLTQILAVVAVRTVQKGMMQQTVQQTESRLRDVVESISEGMLVTDRYGRIELWNEALERSTGRSRGEVLGRSLLESFPNLEGTPLARALARSVEAGEKESLDEVHFGDDIDRVFEARVFPFADGTTVFINDVTERRVAEKARRETEERYKALVDNASIGIYRTTPEGKVLMANPALANMLGYSSFEELANRDLATDDFEPDYEREKFKRQLERDGSVSGLESVWRRRDNSAAFVRENARAVRGEDGEILYYEGTVEDITERKRAENALLDSQALFDSLVNSLPQHVFCKDTDGTFTFGNKSFCAWLGTPLGEVVGKRDSDLFAREVAERNIQADKLILESGRTLDSVEEFVTPDGRASYVQVVRTPRYDSRGGVVGLQGIFWDVTEKRIAEDALAHERDLLHALMNNTPDYIYFKDARGRFVRINKALAELLGVDDPKDAVGKTDRDFFASDQADDFNSNEEQIVRTGVPIIGKVENAIKADGSSHWVLTTKVPMRDSEGAVAGIIGISKDITERKEAEEALEQSLQRFLGVVSAVSEGDLTRRGAEGEDTLGRIALSVNKMLDNFSGMLNQVKQAALSVSSSAIEILAASEQMAVASNRQSEAVGSTSSEVEEMAASMVQVSRNADASAEAARHALATAQSGDSSVRDTSEAMLRINGAVQQTAERMRALAERSSEISQIINLINDVASQTNLLALNAAIEAAHAGDAGLGFSVVAEEIRKLAERSARAVKDVNRLITSVQHETTEALTATEMGMKEVGEGTRLADQARQSLQNISTVVRQSADLIEEISVASEEQARMTRSVASAMQTISGITLQASAGTQQNARTLQGMVELSERLNQEILQFKISEDLQGRLPSNGDGFDSSSFQPRGRG
ncbi:MAG TPA: PAS domain S-box protein [Blastocatellia bacterium]|nr:PAS domain S-box protein [Blastocatellia bacterium]